MVELIKKLTNLEINTFQTYIYFNMYMTQSVFFGCRVISLSDKQNKELKKLYEAPIAKNLGLGEKFPQKIMYSWQSTLGVGLIEPKTYITIAVVK